MSRDRNKLLSCVLTLSVAALASAGELAFYDIAALRYSTARPMDGAEILGTDGVWHAVQATQADGVWTLGQRLACMEFALVRW